MNSDRRIAGLLAVLATVILSGCGESERPTREEVPVVENPIVDTTAEPPIINALDVDPSTGDFLLTTNKGYWRIGRESREATRVDAQVKAPSGSAPLGTFLYLKVIEGKTLIGSGHPDTQGSLPEFLGFIRSEDGGTTWKVLSRLGEADLHKIEVVGDRLYAFDAVLGALLISDDGGKTFEERFTPRGLIIDFVVDPEDSEHILAATEDQLFETRDGGRAWRPLAAATGVRLAWPGSDRLFRADRDGSFYRSTDAGASWDTVGKVEGEPYKIEPGEDGELFVATSDGRILESDDEGASWTEAFTP